MAQIVQDDLEKETQLFMGGQFVAGWNQFDVPDDIRGRLESMLESAYDQGRFDQAERTGNALKQIINGSAKV